MRKENAVTKVNDMITELTERKASQLAEIQRALGVARVDEEKAEQAMKEATERMDHEAYTKAERARAGAQSRIEMYSTRYLQLQSNEYVTEEESDRMIRSILDYEEKREEEFRKALKPKLESLTALLNEYRVDVASAEETLNTWTTVIHANYRTIDGTRNKKSFPVHVVPYTGCNEALRLGEYLSDAKSIIDG